MEQFHFDIGNAQLSLRYNIGPTQEVAAVRQVDGKRQLALFRWDLIPSWAKDTKIASSTINARADTVATKPMFLAAYKRRRCLVLGDGYYEWLPVGKTKRPYLYEIEGGKPFAFAGLWTVVGGRLPMAPSSPALLALIHSSPSLPFRNGSPSESPQSRRTPTCRAFQSWLSRQVEPRNSHRYASCNAGGGAAL